MSKYDKDKLKEDLDKAFAGDIKWMDEMIRGSGYVNPNVGIQQKEIISAGITSRKILADWEVAGLESKTISRNKYYPLIEFIRFMFHRRSKSEDGGNKEYQKWNAEAKKQTALEKMRRNDIEIGKLIDRYESDRKFVSLIMHVIAAIETAYGGLAPQLVNKNIEQIRKIIDKRTDWLCQEMQNNRTPVPSKLAGDQIKKIVREETEQIG